MFAVRRLLTTVLVLAALLLAVDRGAAYGASQFADSSARRMGAGDVNIRILGFPFVTQVARGDLTTVTVSERALTSHGISIDSLYATGHGIHLSLSDLLNGTVTTVPIDQVTGSALITYGTLSAGLSRVLGLGAAFSLTFSAAGPGHLVVHLHGPLNVTVADTVPAPTVAGGRLNVGAFLRQLLPFLPAAATQQVSVPLPTLPYGLTLTSAAAEPDGIHLVVSGQNITVPTSG